MRKFLAGMVFVAVLLSFVVVHPASAESNALDNRVLLAKEILGQIMQSPDQSIPEELLAKCKAIAIYPRVLKGAFIFGGRFGKGVVLRRDEKTGQWGAPAFSTIAGGNWGLQIGGQATDLVLVVMNDRGLDGLLNSKFTLGGDASVAAGPVGRASSAGTDLSLSSSIVSYSRNYGLFAGISLDGAIVTHDDRSNTEYYGRPTTSYDVLSRSSSVVPPASAVELMNALEEYSSRWYKNPKSINKDVPQVKKYDFEGEITSIDYRESEIELLDLRPIAERGLNAPASREVKVNPNEIANFKIKDHVKIIFKGTSKDNEVHSIVKV